MNPLLCFFHPISHCPKKNLYRGDFTFDLDTSSLSSHNSAIVVSTSLPAFFRNLPNTRLLLTHKIIPEV